MGLGQKEGPAHPDGGGAQEPIWESLRIHGCEGREALRTWDVDGQAMGLELRSVVMAKQGGILSWEWGGHRLWG